MKYKYDIALSFAMENQELVNKVYHYLKREGLSVFYAPAQECQIVLSAENQREVFYGIFGMEAKFVALFVSKDYIRKEIPMEEATIAFAKHGHNHTVIPIYLDGTKLPPSLFDEKQINYFSSDNPAVIAMHLTEKYKQKKKKIQGEKNDNKNKRINVQNIMNINGNYANEQNFIHHMEGKIIK